MENLLLRNVLVIDTASKWHHQQADILIKNGEIAEIGPANSIQANVVSQVEGGAISPGWVDMRVQLTDPGQEQREDLSSLAKAAMKGGFTVVLGMPNTQPVLDNAGQVQALLGRAEKQPIHILVAGALSQEGKGNELAELYDMHLSGAKAFTDGKKGSKSAGLMLRALQYVQPFNALVISSPIDMSIAGDSLVGDSQQSVLMGLKGMPELAETMQIDRDLRLLEYTNGTLHVGPVTTKKGLQSLLAAKENGAKLSIETSALYLLLDDRANLEFDPVTKVWPPLRTAADAQALREALAKGQIEVVSSSHHPQGLEEKTHDFPDAEFGASTLETAFSAILTAMSDFGALDQVVSALGSNPRKLLGLPSATIEVGAAAELSHFDPNATWIPEKKDIRSKSKFNPLLGKELKGKVLGIYAKGKYHPQAD